MPARQAYANSDTPAGTIWLMKIGEALRVEYDAVEPPLPKHLATLLEQFEAVSSARRPTCPRCKATMVTVMHARGLGGHPGLGGYACPNCRYIAGGRVGELLFAGKH
jgi:transposase-like protein